MRKRTYVNKPTLHAVRNRNYGRYWSDWVFI